MLDHELKKLLNEAKEKEQTAFCDKQIAWAKYAEARDLANSAHDSVSLVNEECQKIRRALDQEYEAMQFQSKIYEEIWEKYDVIRDCILSQAEKLRQESATEHAEMISCFQKASDAFERGDKSMAQAWARRGHKHKDRRNELNAMIKKLFDRMKEAKEQTRAKAPETDSSSFKRINEEYLRKKQLRDFLIEEFKKRVEERNIRKAKFDLLYENHQRIKEEYRRLLAEYNSRNTTIPTVDDETAANNSNVD